METSAGIPVIFTAFANPHGDLPDLNQEQNGIQDALAPLEADGKLKHLLRTNTDLTGYFDFLQRWKGQIVIFHFGGHADSEALAFQNAGTFFKPLAEELVARNSESLRLVFLNGCSTLAHVETLFNLGVPAVIATSVPVDDVRAREFAVRFYSNVARGDGLVQAYRSAANYTKGKSTEARFRHLGEVQVWRSIGKQPGEDGGVFPWGLYLRKDGALSDKELVVANRDSIKGAVPLVVSRKKCLWLWLWFAGIVTLLTLAQQLLGEALSGIELTAWFWVMIHLYPGLILLSWSILAKREMQETVPQTIHSMIRRVSLIYLILVLGTVLIEPAIPADISIGDHLLRSYFWLEPLNGLLLVMYWRVFMRGKSLPGMARR